MLFLSDTAASYFAIVLHYLLETLDSPVSIDSSHYIESVLNSNNLKSAGILSP